MSAGADPARAPGFRHPMRRVQSPQRLPGAPGPDGRRRRPLLQQMCWVRSVRGGVRACRACRRPEPAAQRLVTGSAALSGCAACSQERLVASQCCCSITVLLNLRAA